MTNSKNTKRALLASVLSVLLCVAMLIGSTFAWFTDSVTSGKNQIVAGNLDVELEYTTDFNEWKTVEDATELFKKDALWEPGHAEVVYLRMRNAGTLALKYKFGMNIVSETDATNVNGETFKLSQYLQYGVVEGQQSAFADRSAAIAAVENPTSLAGYSKEGTMLAKAEPQYLALVVYMPETVGNEANYRGEVVPTIDLGLNLVATQTPHESDSFDNQYDENAEYPILVANTEDLRDAMMAENAKITLADNITITDTALAINEGQTVEIDLDGKIIDVPQGSTDNICTFINQGGNLILKNGFIRNGDITDGNFNADSPNRNAAIESYGGMLMVENCVISNSAGNSGSYSVKLANDSEGNGCVASFKNCEITGTRGGLNAMGDAKVAFDGGSIKAGYYYPFYIDGNAVATFNGTEFIKATGTAGGNFIVYSAAYDYETGEATFNNCTFKSERANTKFLTWWNDTGSKKIPFTFNGCTFDNVTDNYND